MANFDCTNPSDLKEIIKTHRISADEYEAYVNAYFPDGPVAPFNLTLSDMQGLVERGDCQTQKYYVVGSDPSSNEDFTFKLVDASEPVSPCYSVALLKGALLLLGPDSIEFSRAITDVKGAESTVVFRIFDKNGVVVYNADLTEAYP
jgi:hypothetical protein